MAQATRQARQERATLKPNASVGRALAQAMENAEHQATQPATQATGPAMRTGTAAAMTGEPMGTNKPKTLAGSKSAILSNAADVYQNIIKVYVRTKGTEEKAQARMVELFDVFQRSDDTARKAAVNIDNHPEIEQGSFEYVALSQTRTLLRVWSDAPKQREVLTAETVTVPPKAGAEPVEQTSWRARIKKAQEISKAIKAHNAEIKLRNSAIVQATNDDGELDTEAYQTKLAEAHAKQQEAAAQAAEEKETAQYKATQFCKLHMYGKLGMGEEKLREFIKLLPSTLKDVIAAHAAELADIERKKLNAKA